MRTTYAKDLGGVIVSDNDWYYKLVDECASKSKDINIDNGMADHARYLIMKLFDVSDHTVQIYSGCLKRTKNIDCDVYSWDRLISAANSFLTHRNGRLEILLEKNIDGGNENEFIKALKSSPRFKYNCEIRQVGDTKIDKHFVVSDAKGYRLETNDHEVTAVANFNDPENARKYANIFGVVFSKSKEALV